MLAGCASLNPFSRDDTARGNGAVADAGTTDDGDRGPDATAPPMPVVPYTTEIAGEIDDELRARLRSASQTASNEERGAPTVAALRRRLADDVTRLNEVMRAEGYFSATIETRLVRGGGEAPEGAEMAGTPAGVPEPGRNGTLVARLVIDPGPRSTFNAFRLDYVESADPGLPRTGTPMGYEPGGPARAERIVAFTRDAITYLANLGYPLAEVQDRRAVADLTAQTVGVTLKIKPGPKLAFGPVTVDGLDNVDEDYVRALLTFKEGQTYDQSAVQRAARRVRETGLFDYVTIERLDPVEGTQPLRMKVGERDHRSVGAGIRWSSNEGFGVRTFWEHRNILGAGERLRTELRATELDQSAAARLRKPLFLRDDQALLASFELTSEDTDAFDEDKVRLSTAIERTLSPTYTASAGISFEFIRNVDIFGTRNAELLGLPLKLRHDSTDDILDPTLGNRFSVSVTPYAGSAGTAAGLIRTEGTASLYWSFGDLPDVTLAGRARAGSILVDETADVPGSIRFYAGGGGSVRGFEFQTVGPLDAQGNPLGGRSVIEIGAEVRYRLSETIGIVPFIEGGNVYDTIQPDPTQKLFWGAGLGLRYYSVIGPVRADVAIPINRRGSDDSFQIYVSIGQAF